MDSDLEYRSVLDLVDKWNKFIDDQLAEQFRHRARHSQDKPTVHPASPFDPCADAEILRKAMKGLGTDEEAIVGILTKRSLSQRQDIILKYQQTQGRDLIKDLKSELSGHLEKVLLSLMKPLPLYLAEQICSATKGAGTAEDALIEILCTREDDDLQIIKAAFEELTDKTIEKVVCKDTSGSFEKTLMAVLTACRDDSGTSVDKVVDELCLEDVCEDVIRKILVTYSFPFLRSVFIKYCDKTGVTFDKLVESKCSGYTKKAFCAMFKSVQCKSDFYAEALHEAMARVGTDDCALVRIIVSRCEIDLGTIKQKYFAFYEKNLQEEIMAEVSGDYRKALVCLVEN